MDLMVREVPLSEHAVEEHKVPFCLPHFHYRRVGPRAGGGGSFLPNQVCKAYGFPAVAVTSDPLIAIMQLGGGYMASDTQQTMAAQGLPMPTVTEVSVQGASNQPGDAADAEVALDVQLASSAYSYMTGRPANILLIWAPNTNAGYAAAVALAGQRGAACLSTSWGAPERAWGNAYQAVETAARANLAAGCINLAAAGDNDSGDGAAGTNVDYPASSASFIGCCGTSLSINTLTGTLMEKVWNDGQGGGTGGGYSRLFTRPSFQNNVNSNSNRGVGDLAANADPATGYQIVVDGQTGVVGGTSAVAPLMAGFFAACFAAGVKRGSVLPLLYGNPQAFNDVVIGTNGAYTARVGWDEPTGLGSPRGSALLLAMMPSSPPVSPPPPISPPPPVTGTLGTLTIPAGVTITGPATFTLTRVS